MTQQATNLSQQTATAQAAQRPGKCVGTVSELTVIAPLKPGGADALRAKFNGEKGLWYAGGADKVGTLHDMRWVIIDNDTRLLFCTAYDGDWDTYIDDFATKIPEIMDDLFSVLEGWTGITSPEVKDFIVQHQITATSFYCAYPNSSVKQVLKGQKVLQAFESLLDTAAG